MTLQQLLLVLAARRQFALRILFGIIGLVAVISLIMPRQYTATTTVVVDVKSPDPIAGIVLPGLTEPGYMTTQVDIISSDRVAQRVVRMLKLDEVPEIRERWRQATEGKGDIAVWMAALLQKKLDVKPGKESNVIEIDFSGLDPDFSAAVANAFAQAYIDTSIDLRVQPARQTANWYDSQLKAQRDRLEAAQKALSDYQQKTGIIATDERLDYETQKLNELSGQLTLAEVQGGEAASKWKEGNANTLPEIIQNPMVAQLKTDLARMESKLRDLSVHLGAEHPQYRAAQAEAAELRARLNGEMANIYHSVNTSSRVSKARADEIRAAIDIQKKRLLDLKRQRDEISVLMRDVDSAQRAFDAVGQRVTQSKLESQAVQTNISVLTPASPPLEPSRPLLLLNLLGATLVGGVIAIAAALMREARERRIRSVDDLLVTLDMPVLVEVDSARRRPPSRWLRFGRRGNTSIVTAEG